MMQRRSFLRGASFALGMPATGSLASRMAEMGDRSWTSVSSPTSETLHAVARTVAGPFAAGSNGVVVGRTDAGWEAVRRNGPGGDGNNLQSLAATGDGERLWMAGASGALGEYDVAGDELTDRTAPDGVTNTLTAVAVTGEAGEATVFLGDAAGTVHVSRENGRAGSWTHLTPGDGSAIRDVACYGPNAAVLVDADATVFATTDGDHWRRIGVDDAEGDLYAVDATRAGDVAAVGAGVYLREGGDWRSPDLTAAACSDVAVCSCGCVHAVGASGTVLHRPGRGMRTGGGSHGGGGGTETDGGRWKRSSPTGQNLHGVVTGRPHVAVGASGTVLER